MFIGLTGGIGSGKSTVAKMFKKYDIPVIDADDIAREVVEPYNEAWEKIVEFFGEEILLPDKTVNRQKLGSIIFRSEKKRKILNEITHPIIISRIKTKAEQLQKNYHNVIADIPLLFESKREDMFDLIIVVYVNKEIQVKRLMERDNISKEDALLKINVQMSLEEKKAKADIVIYNDQGIEETEKQVRLLIKKLKTK